MKICPFCGVLIASANAKLNWYVNETKTSAVVSEPHDEL